MVSRIVGISSRSNLFAISESVAVTVGVVRVGPIEILIRVYKPVVVGVAQRIVYSDDQTVLSLPIVCHAVMVGVHLNRNSAIRLRDLVLGVFGFQGYDVSTGGKFSPETITLIERPRQGGSPKERTR
jgi:hypothetical protein